MAGFGWVPSWVELDVMQHNRGAWNRHANNGSPWSGSVSTEEVARAREGEWKVILIRRRRCRRIGLEITGAKKFLGWRRQEQG